MIKVGIIGATGYAGAELARILQNHKYAEVISYGSRSYSGDKFSSIYRNFESLTNKECVDEDLLSLSKEVDVIFTATPGGFTSANLNKEILENAKVIDLSGDYRFKDASVYEKWYKTEHKNKELLKEAVYGLCEINREKIKGARLVANPGCYTTCSILTAYPLIKEGVIDGDSLIVDAMSGVSGAGRGAKIPNLFCEVNESAKPYGVADHRHTPEIEEQLSIAAGKDITINFTPHLIPINRGILVTEYANLKTKITMDEIKKIYDKYYGKEKFIRVLQENYPEIRFVKGSNFVDIAFKIDERTNRVILMGALDNLIKGAAGAAVQNMNILFDIDESHGLCMVPCFP